MIVNYIISAKSCSNRCKNGIDQSIHPFLIDSCNLLYGYPFVFLHFFQGIGCICYMFSLPVIYDYLVSLAGNARCQFLYNNLNATFSGRYSFMAQHCNLHSIPPKMDACQSLRIKSNSFNKLSFWFANFISSIILIRSSSLCPKRTVRLLNAR